MSRVKLEGTAAPETRYLLKALVCFLSVDHYEPSGFIVQGAWKV